MHPGHPSPFPPPTLPHLPPLTTEYGECLVLLNKESERRIPNKKEELITNQKEKKDALHAEHNVIDLKEEHLNV